MSAPFHGGGAGPPDADGTLPLTVREVLEMPAFAAARLVAGHAGIDNPVEWAHVVDMPDAAFDWGRERVLVLTAGYGLGDEATQQALVPRLAERGFAGLVLSRGYAVDEAPPPLRAAADEHALPLIETPQDVLFISLTEAIFAQLVNRQYALLRRSTDVQDRLTDLVLRGGDLDDVAATLAGLLRRSVTIEDTDFRVLATARHGPVDEARRRSVAEGRATAEMARHLVDSGLYRQLLDRMGPVRVAPMPAIDMTMDRIVAPIIVDRDLQGYIWIIAGEHPLTDLDELAIDRGATVAALVLLKERAVREAAANVRGDVLQQLLSDHGSPTDLAERAHEVGLRMDRPHQVLLVLQPTASVEEGRSLAEAVSRWLAGADVVGVTAGRPDGVVVVLETADQTVGEAVAHRLVAALGDRPVVVGVGGIAAPGADGAAALRRSHREAREAAQVAAALGERGRVRAFWRLGLLHWLRHLPDEVRAGNRYVDLVTALDADDRARGTSLLPTLEAYLEHGGATAATARALHLHRNTLLHRLDRLEQACGVDLRDPAVRLDLHVAVTSYRLHGGDRGRPPLPS